MSVRSNMTIEQVRGYFAFKNDILAMNVGLRLPSGEVLNVIFIV